MLHQHKHPSMQSPAAAGGMPHQNNDVLQILYLAPDTQTNDIVYFMEAYIPELLHHAPLHFAVAEQFEPREEETIHVSTSAPGY